MSVANKIIGVLIAGMTGTASLQAAYLGDLEVLFSSYSCGEYVGMSKAPGWDGLMGIAIQNWVVTTDGGNSTFPAASAFPGYCIAPEVNMDVGETYSYKMYTWDDASLAVSNPAYWAHKEEIQKLTYYFSAMNFEAYGLGFLDEGQRLGVLQASIWKTLSPELYTITTGNTLRVGVPKYMDFVAAQADIPADSGIYFYVLTGQNGAQDQFVFTNRAPSVPEPASLSILSLSSVGLWMSRRK